MTGKSILVVEDNGILRMVTVEIIRSLDCIGDIYQAPDGQEGLDQIKEYRPDIILTDQGMPRKTGSQMLYEMLKIEDYTPKIAVISGGDMDSARENLRTYPLEVRYLEKPCGFDDISGLVTEFCED